VAFSLAASFKDSPAGVFANCLWPGAWSSAGWAIQRPPRKRPRASTNSRGGHVFFWLFSALAPSLPWFAFAGDISLERGYPVFSFLSDAISSFRRCAVESPLSRLAAASQVVQPSLALANPGTGPDSLLLDTSGLRFLWLVTCYHPSLSTTAPRSQVAALRSVLAMAWPLVCYTFVPFRSAPESGVADSGLGSRSGLARLHLLRCILLFFGSAAISPGPAASLNSAIWIRRRRTPGCILGIGSLLLPPGVAPHARLGWC